MTKNRPFYCLKFNSSRLKEFGYNIDITFEHAKRTKEIIALSDSQFLRSIRDIRGTEFDADRLDEFIKERNRLMSSAQTTGDKARIFEIKGYIRDMTFIEDYITVVIEHKTHYDHIFKNGFIINGKRFVRLSCSAGQARVSTVIFCNEDIEEELKRRTNNGRNTDIPIAPSKFNAYFGLNSSATKTVSEPRFIVVKDFNNTTSFRASFVSETEWDKDDIVEERDMTDYPVNRTDGMGLISPEQSAKWAEELGLDYTPSQWCVRQSFLKGMLCTFPIHQFCEEVNEGSYIVDTIYTDSEGKPIKADLRECDVIITESMFKLWDSYKSADDYMSNYRNNKLFWGVSQYTPKKAKDVLDLNYQFIQTLNLGEDEIKALAQPFVDWLESVSYADYGQMRLFLTGGNMEAECVADYINNRPDNWWIKALLLAPAVMNDKYILKKIKELIKMKLQNACMGKIFAEGNFQPIVSDPYGFMQHVCGLPVKGLLKAGEFYSNYWNAKNVSRVNSMRSPLTYRSEHVILNLVNRDEVRKWYRYCDLGIIVNYHGHEALCWGGADFDYDILATTSNPVIIGGGYMDELPIVYEAPKPKKIIFTEEDLYKADTFAFGSIIGSITNKSSNAYAMLPNIEKQYGKDSDEHRILLSRLKQCCKAQGKQIDKAKIGEAVKGIPDAWITKGKSETFNHILMNKPPYFFRYRYSQVRREYSDYVSRSDITCQHKFRLTIEELLAAEEKTEEQKNFLENYYKYMPVIYSDAPVNILCRHLENKKVEINKSISNIKDLSFIDIYKNREAAYTDEQYKAVVRIIKNRATKYLPEGICGDDKSGGMSFDKEKRVNAEFSFEVLLEELCNVCGNIRALTNILIDYYYIECPSSSKDVIWLLFGEVIVENIKKNLCLKKISFPIASDCGTIEFLKKRYEKIEVKI